MPTYHLYLEQGPPAKRTGARKTMVHVLDLLGCAPKAKSEEAALALVPSAIEVYARWLSGSGEDIATGPLETVIAERWEGQQDWAGQGYMDGAFQAELAPIDADEVERYVRRFEAMRQAMTAALDALSPDEVAHKPQPGRALQTMALHVVDSAHSYVTAGIGKVGAPPSRPNAPWGDEWERVGAAIAARLRAMTEEERTRVKYSRDKGIPWSARKALRRVLEHTWEHTNEMLVERLGMTL